jgi:hypothetical protein
MLLGAGRIGCRKEKQKKKKKIVARFHLWPPTAARLPELSVNYPSPGDYVNGALFLDPGNLATLWFYGGHCPIEDTNPVR